MDHAWLIEESSRQSYFSSKSLQAEVGQLWKCSKGIHFFGAGFASHVSWYCMREIAAIAHLQLVAPAGVRVKWSDSPWAVQANAPPPKVFSQVTGWLSPPKCWSYLCSVGAVIFWPQYRAKCPFFVFFLVFWINPGNKKEISHFHFGTQRVLLCMVNPQITLMQS